MKRQIVEYEAVMQIAWRTGRVPAVERLRYGPGLRIMRFTDSCQPLPAGVYWPYLYPGG